MRAAALKPYASILRAALSHIENGIDLIRLSLRNVNSVSDPDIEQFKTEFQRLKYQTETLEDIVAIIGFEEENQMHFFNFNGDELVEVDREQYIGTVNEEDEQR